MSERANAAVRVARAVLGVALNGAAESGAFGRGSAPALRAAAELVMSGGHERRPAPVAAPVAATEARRGARTAPPETAPPGDAEPVATPFRAPERRAAPRAVDPVASGPDDDARTAEERRASSATASASTSTPTPAPARARAVPTKPSAPIERRAVAVPSSPIQRVIGFGSLAAGLAAGTISESARRAWRGRKPSNDSKGGDSSSPAAAESIIPGDSIFMTEANAERLAVALCRMRGAALKLGQMLSIQDESVIPPQVQRALERVRQGADVMPADQLEKTVESHLGVGWKDSLTRFDPEPLAAASIGQVHLATVRDPDDPEGARSLDVCMKIQYPGVARSIHSDIDNLMRLVSLTDILPKGLYVEHAVAVAKEELTLECDYEYERESQTRMARLLEDDPHWHVPRVIPALCSEGVITTEYAPGVAIDKAADLPQDERDYIGTQLLRVTLRELFEFRFMQTDPNFANFLYDSPTRRLTLIDFGAAKEFPKKFVDDYLRMVVACAERDRKGLIDASISLGFLTGDESPVLMDAHAEAGFQVGRPFAAEGVYDFGAERDMTRRVAGLGKVMLKHRLTPPPREAYSLHRKLSGAFLACMRIGARVPARTMLREMYEKYEFGEEEAESEEEEAANTA